MAAIYTQENAEDVGSRQFQEFYSAQSKLADALLDLYGLVDEVRRGLLQYGDTNAVGDMLDDLNAVEKLINESLYADAAVAFESLMDDIINFYDPQ